MMTFVFSPVLCQADIPENAVFLDIYEGIGHTIDSKRAQEYGLFTNTTNFVSATYYETPSMQYFVVVKTFDENGVLVTKIEEVPQAGLEWIRQKIKQPPRISQTTPEMTTSPINSKHPLVGAKELSGNVLFTSAEGNSNLELSPSVGYFFTKALEIKVELGISSASDGSGNSFTLTSGFASAIYNAVGEESVIGYYGGLGAGFIRATGTVGTLSQSVTKSAMVIVGGIKTYPTKNNRIGFSMGYTMQRYASLTTHSIGTAISIYFLNK